MRSWIWLFLAGCSAGAPLPPPAAALNAAGVEALARGDLETADARFSVALEYSPRFVEALVNLGLVELERGNFARARLLCERARRYNPDVAQPHHALGVLAERERRPDEASRHYYDALRVDPGFAPARNNLARLLFRGGFVEEALVQYERLVEVAPADPNAAAGLVETLARLGRYGEADARLGAALERFPHAAPLLVLDARRALRQGARETAISTLLPLADRHDEIGAAALAWLATAELASGRPSEASVSARRALSLDPESTVATYALALALRELDAPDAAAWLARARRTSPFDPLLQSPDLRAR
ncbi:MAG TPA: tetratricopeptide repeat protein [Polyangiaceae bacterium]|nr:tetratricopeptide repeat protein [Polyangiaceae bacterium]